MQDSFINSLEKQGAINSETATRILRWVSRNTKPIGMIAVEHGLIDGRQIDEILDRQKRNNRRFGELAVEMGLLNANKVAVLLQIQRLRSFIVITEVLALAGILPLQEGFRSFCAFVDEQCGRAFETYETAEAG